jgi:hypothetical protein
MGVSYLHLLSSYFQAGDVCVDLDYLPSAKEEFNLPFVETVPSGPPTIILKRKTQSMRLRAIIVWSAYALLTSERASGGLITCGIQIRTLPEISITMEDPTITRLRQAVEKMHGCNASWIEEVPVRETFKEQTAWEGTVHVFDLTGTPKSDTRLCVVFAYARRP